MPALFENGILITDSPVQQDMLLLGMATTISHLLPKFFFRHGYPATEYGANLMTLILAPSASGKGILKRSLHMVEWHEHILPGNASVSAFINELDRTQEAHLRCQALLDALPDEFSTKQAITAKPQKNSHCGVAELRFFSATPQLRNGNMLRE